MDVHPGKEGMEKVKTYTQVVGAVLVVPGMVGLPLWARSGCSVW